MGLSFWCLDNLDSNSNRNQSPQMGVKFRKPVISSKIKIVDLHNWMYFHLKNEALSSFNMPMYTILIQCIQQWTNYTKLKQKYKLDENNIFSGVFCCRTPLDITKLLHIFPYGLIWLDWRQDGTKISPRISFVLQCYTIVMDASSILTITIQSYALWNSSYGAGEMAQMLKMIVFHPWNS